VISEKIGISNAVQVVAERPIGNRKYFVGSPLVVLQSGTLIANASNNLARQTFGQFDNSFSLGEFYTVPGSTVFLLRT